MPRSPLEFSGYAGLLLADSRPFLFKGITWAGGETVARVPHGLQKLGMDYYFDFLQGEKFNAVRFLFAHQSVLDDASISYTHFEPKANPQLVDADSGLGVSYIKSLVQLVRAAAAHDILVVLACQRLKANAPNYGLWYNDTLGVSEQSTFRGWELLADALCGEWNVVGVDLYQEPYRATWGSQNQRTDWKMGAERLGNHVLGRCSRWLVFVQGIHTAAPEDGGATQGYFWVRLLRFEPLCCRREASALTSQPCPLPAGREPSGRYEGTRPTVVARQTGLLAGARPIARCVARACVAPVLAPA